MRRSAAPSQKSKEQSQFMPPFKRPCLKQISPLSNKNESFLSQERSTSVGVYQSNVKLSNHKDINDRIVTDNISPRFNTENKPTAVNVSYNTSIASQDSTLDCTKYYSVVWCKMSKKKHKKWEGDAVLIVKSRSVTLKDMEGKSIGCGTGYKLQDLSNLEAGNTLPVGGKEIEIQAIISKDSYNSGKCFQGGPIVDPEPCGPVVSKPKFKPFCLPTRGDSNIKRNPTMKSLYDPAKPDAIVMPCPPCGHQFRYNSKSLPITDVVIDPYIASKLRPHQREGIVFLYECIMGFRIQDFHGAILADEMGLGKTLQCITLIWTLYKQGPYGCEALLKKVLIITPSSISANWGKEFDKWLGPARIRTFIVDQQNKMEDFVKQRICPVLIISYEMAIRNIDLINKVSFDLMLCDEGHRLKNTSIKTTNLLSKVNIKKRVLATGTPIQNDLQELFALVEFVNPGILGSSLMFKRVYEEPIIRAQQPGASAEEKGLGERRAAELNKVSSQFILRRTQEIINRYLPPKNEYVVFCGAAKSQSDLYEKVVSSRGLQQCLSESETGDHLAAICILRKLCNHPALLSAYEQKENLSVIQTEISSLLPPKFSSSNYEEEDSGKLAVVSCMLWSLSETKRERIVIVSNFTTTLDMLQQLCQRYSYSFLRLDGSTPISKRQSLVDKFNAPSCSDFVFLLSAKAGGVGLNLIGASRIILFDVDWNPATDLQAMARVWRDGQKKEVFIYRLLLAGSIEEKIYQRQVCKQGISGSVVDARLSGKVKFSVEELKDLFQFYPEANCLTHESLVCSCNQDGGLTLSNIEERNDIEKDCQLVENEKKRNTTMDQLHSWQHFMMPEKADLLRDPPLEAGADFINFVFKTVSSC